MKIRKMILATIALFFSASSQAVPITTLEITGGHFSMAGVGGDILPAAYANLTIGGYDGIPWLTCGCTYEINYPVSVATIEFGFFGNVAVFTMESDGVNSGFAPPTGDLIGSDLWLDLSSWTAKWNGTSFNQGAIISTTVDTAGNFTANWQAQVIGGAYNGQTADWTVTGIVSTVPVPSAVWLFGSGLLGLAGIARRKKV